MKHYLSDDDDSPCARRTRERERDVTRQKQRVQRKQERDFS